MPQPKRATRAIGNDGIFAPELERDDLANLLTAAKLVNHCDGLLSAGKQLPPVIAQELAVIAALFGRYLDSME